MNEIQEQIGDLVLTVKRREDRIEELEEFIHDYVATDAMSREDAKIKARLLIPKWFE